MTGIRAGVITGEGHVKAKSCKQANNKRLLLTNTVASLHTSMQSLTVEGLGADLAVRSGHSTAMTRRGDGVTLLHLLSCTSGCL